MADVKISALPLATTPLAGTEVLPIVQSATTDQVTVANLTAGRAVSAASLSLTNPLSVANGGTNAASAGITAFNNITGYTATGATGTTSTNLVFSTSPVFATPAIIGSSSGKTTLASANSSATNYTATIPAKTGNIAMDGPLYTYYLNSPQSLTTGVVTKIQYDTLVYDTASAYDAVTNYRFTPQVAGYYLIKASMAILGATILSATLYIYKNGGAINYYYFPQALSPYTTIPVSAIVYLNGSTDYIEIWGAISATSPSIQAASSSSWVEGSFIRGA